MKRLYRSQTDRKIAGICGGLGEMFGVDAGPIRLTLVFGAAVLVLIYRSVVGILPMLVAYVVGWIIVPVAAAHEGHEAPRMKRLYRSQTDRKIAGICGGLGGMLSVDPTFIRLSVVFVALVTAILPVVIAYLVGWIIIPPVPPAQEHQARIMPSS